MDFTKTGSVPTFILKLYEILENEVFTMIT